MKIITLLFIIIILSVCCIAQVNGIVQDIDGKKVLIIWGTHYERGYAHGYLLGNEIVTIINDYIIDYVCFGSAVAYNSMHGFFMVS